MSPTYSTINVRPHVAQLARTLAKSRGIPVGALIEQLIESQVTTEVSRAETVETVDDQIRISLGDMFLQLPVEDARYFAKQLRDAVEGRSASLNMDTPRMVAVGRRGAGVIVEITPPGQQRIRSTTGTHEAASIADALDRHLASKHPEDQALA